MKKTEELSVRDTAAFVEKQCAYCFLNTGEDVFEFSKRVAKRAEDIAHKFYADMLPDYNAENKKSNISAVVHCALLSEVFHYGNCCFEDVADICNVQVAAMVAALSRDRRLVETKRDTEFRGRLSQSSLGAQIVALSRIICFAQSTKDYFDRASLTGAVKIKKNLAQMDADLLSIQAANLYYVVRTHVHAARNILIEISHSLKKKKQAAKNEKLVLHYTKKLRESSSATQKNRKARAAKKSPSQAKTAKKSNGRSTTKRSRKKNSE